MCVPLRTSRLLESWEEVNTVAHDDQVAPLAADVTADQETVVLLTVEGVRLATYGYTDDIHKEGFAPLKDVIRQFLDNGGQLWACRACTKPRGIGEADLIPGAKIVTAANVVEYMASGASTLSF